MERSTTETCDGRPEAPACFCDDPEPATALGLDDFDPASLARVARGLANPARVAIVAMFDDGIPKMTGDIVAASGLAQSTVSEHLRILRDAGILVALPDGPRIWYCLHRSVLRSFADRVVELAQRR